MPFDWKEFLDLARYLQGRAGAGFTQGASSRCAVGRAYFAAYGVAEDHAEREYGFRRTRGATDHRRLRDCFREQGRDDIAGGLDELRAWRNQCDYDDVVPQLEMMVDWALQSADGVLGQL